MRDAVIHGGDVWEIATKYGTPVESLIDFSANINPRGLPPGAMERLQREAADAALLAKYPDPSYTALCHALAKRDGISPDSILIGEGAEALIGATLRAIRPVRCLIPIPAFSEYMRACASAGTQVVTLELQPREGFLPIEMGYVERLVTEACDFAVLNNPHNPTGQWVRKQMVIGLADRIRATGACFLVDEAFVDYAPDETIVDYASQVSGVVVIRSLTKFFGCPALRVGYAVGHPETLKQIAAVQPAWPVTLIAANALEEALKDKAYAANSLRENQGRRESLARSLRKLGAQVSRSAANFLLIRLREQWPHSAATREHLVRRHRIVVRNCDSYSGLEKGRYIRVAVRTARDNNLLLEGLREIWR